MFEFPFERGRFSTDGATVYMGTSISGEPADNLHCYLYAIQTADARACSYSIYPLSRSFTSSAGEDSVNVVAPNNCDWTATSNADWITITSAASGSGNETVTYIVRDNNATGPRTGTLTIAGQTFTVTQSGTTGECTFTLSPTSKSFGKNGGTASVSVSAGDGCSWSASRNASWITITSAGSAVGNGVVTYSVSVNSGGLARVGTMLIGAKTFTVKQKPR